MDAFDPWVKTVLKGLGGGAGDAINEPPRSSWVISSVPTPQPTAAGPAAAPLRPCPPGYHFARLAAATEQTATGYNRPVRQFDFDLTGSGLSYTVGDHAAILPRNDPARVRSFLEWYGLPGSQLISIVPANLPLKESPIPTQLSIAELFEQYLDITAPPTRRLARDLALFASNPQERSALLALADPENKQSGMDMLAKNVQTDEFLTRFPNTVASLPLDSLASLLPLIKPRFYSIASASGPKPNLLELVIVLYQWQTPSKVQRTGLSTGYLWNLKTSADPSLPIWVPLHVHTGLLTPPADSASPIVMFGLGCGMAYVRGFLQHRAWQQQQGLALGPCDFWFGCRHRSKDFIYEQQYNEYMKSGVLTNLYSAFSHDQKEFVTVITIMDQHPEWIWNMLNNPKTHYYYCGPALGIPESVLAGMERAAIKAGRLSKEKAAALIQKIKKERWFVEAF